MRISETKLREFIQTEEAQYHERKSLLVQRPGLAATRRDRATVRDQIAEYVAGFANAEGGTLILGVEDDGRLTGHQYPADVIDTMLRVPEAQLTPPQPRGYSVVFDGHELLVFEVEGALVREREERGTKDRRCCTAPWVAGRPKVWAIWQRRGLTQRIYTTSRVRERRRVMVRHRVGVTAARRAAWLSFVGSRPQG